MINECIKVIYLGEDISDKIESVEIRPELRFLITNKLPSICVPSREVVLRLFDGSVIETNVSDCEVRVTKGASNE